MSSVKDETVYLSLDDIGPSGLSTEVSRKGGITECFQKVQVRIQESRKQEDMGEPACNKNTRLSGAGDLPAEDTLRKMLLSELWLYYEERLKRNAANKKIIILSHNKLDDELEQQLEIAETRCGTLKQQLDYMKMLYKGIGPPKLEPDKVKKDEEEVGEEPKKPIQVKASPQRPRTSTSLEHKGSFVGCNSLEEVDTAGQKENSKLVVDLTRLGTDGRQKNVTDKKITVQPDGGGHPEATSAEQVIQDILCGISDSVNRISFLNDHIGEGINERSKIFYNSTPAESGADERPLQNICSDGAIEQMLISDEKVRKRKKPQTRGGRQEIVHDCPIESGRSVVLSSRRKHRKHHRPRTVGLYTPSNPPNQHQPPNYVPQIHAKEKRLKVQGTCIDSTRRDDMTSSSPTKTKKKRGKLKLPRTCNARSHSSISAELDNVVELYHNTRARPTTSASEDNGKPFEESSTHLFLKEEVLEGVQDRISDETMTVERLIQIPEVYEVTPPPPAPPHLPPPSSIPPPPPPSSLQRISQGMQMVTIPVAQESKLSVAQNRNFQLPTVSSRMKQADRRFQPRFNCRSIPFVVGRSTTPSHNLGLNIQQILSFIKMRHSQAGLPTLSVAGNFLHERTTLSVGMGLSRPGTTTSSHIGGIRRGYCPLAAENRTCKSIGDTFEQGEEQKYPVGSSNEKLSPADNAASYMPDEIKSNRNQRPESVWEVEQEPPPKDKNPNRRCTCFPTRECIDYQKLLSQYLESGEGMSFFQLVQSSSSPVHHIVHHSQPPQTAGKDLEKAVSLHGLSEIKSSRIDENNNHPIVSSCSSRSQGLREVLINLHNDFVRLTRKYEKIQATMTDGGIEEAETLRQLEAIEAELQTKESEITVVMALYKEVLSLKEQVRTLRQRASSQSMETLGMRGRRQRQIIPREPTVSVRLTKLLRTVQQYQDRLRSEL